MNKIYSTIKLFIALVPMVSLVSCNDFLDKNIDDRTEINNVEKIQKLLVSAYPDKTISFLTEMSSDNVTDNGRTYSSANNQEEVYRFKDDIEQSNDDPKAVWNSHYITIAKANEALDAISKIGENPTTLPLKAEALLCRAYSVFCLTNCFCMAYNDSTANSYLGMPYPKVPGVRADSRGTLAETYKNIDADIEAALPLLNDSYLKTAVAFHFNRRAAYAFAARFNLYYQKWEKAQKYATEALGSSPISFMRTSIKFYLNMGPYEIQNAYVNSSEPANFLLVPKYSTMGRMQDQNNYARFNHNKSICDYQTYCAYMPWSKGYDSNNNCLYESHLLYNVDNDNTFTTFLLEFFEVKDQVNRTGYSHIVEVAFSGDETALVRAEANILLNKLDEALVDLNNFVLVHCSEKNGMAIRPTLSVNNLVTFWDKIPAYSWDKNGVVINHTAKKLINTNIELSKQQMALLYTVLQMRRIETMWKGLRFQDVKRWGIEFIHPLDGEKTLVFKANDLRGAIQLPLDVISAGLEENPREK